jgi:ribosomal-protein-alanine N-acetyltransferase
MSAEAAIKDLPNISIARIDEAKLLAFIHQAAFDKAGWSLEQMQESVKNPHNYVIKHGDVGFVLFQLLGDECEVITLAVLPQFQGKGFAREMIIEMLGICGFMKVKKVFLEVSTKNTTALNLYRKFTFIEYNRRSKYYADGSDAILLQLML